MPKQWNHRDRAAEESLIRAAIRKVITEHVAGGDKPPTVKDLADAAGLRRDYLYEHKELLAEFKNSLSELEGKSVAVMDLEAERDNLKEVISGLRGQLSERDEEVRHLRLLLAETTYALEQEQRGQVGPPDGPPHLQSV